MFETKSVGIDIQPDSVRIAVVSQQGGRTRVLNLFVKEIPEASGHEARDTAVSAIRSALGESGTDGDMCVACLPASSSINRVVSTPLTDAAKIRQTLKFQIEPQIPYPVDQVISDCVTIRKRDDGTEVLAIAVTKEPISDRLQLLNAAGVDTRILTLDALALADFYVNPFDFSPDRVTALLLAGPRSSFLGFFTGERLLGYRNLDGIDPGDQKAVGGMVRELYRSLVGFQSSASEGMEIGALCIAAENGEPLREVLQEEFRELPVRCVGFNERSLVEIPPDLSATAEDCRLAIALARAGLEASANSVNFLQEEYAPASALSRLKSSIVFSFVVLAVALVAWFASVQAQIHGQSNQIKALNDEMLKIFAETMPGIKSASAAEQRIKQEQEKFKSLKNYSSEYVSALEVLAEIVKSVPEKTNLMLNDLVSSDNVLRMTGTVDSFDDIDAFKKRIESSPLFSGVKIDSATKAEKGKKVNFRIRARIRKESAPEAGSVARSDS